MPNLIDELSEYPQLKYWVTHYSDVHPFGDTIETLCDYLAQEFGFAYAYDFDLETATAGDILQRAENIARQDCADCGDEFPNLQADSVGVVRCGVCGSHGVNA